MRTFLFILPLIGTSLATVVDLGYAKYQGQVVGSGELENFGPIRYAAKPERWGYPTEPNVEDGAVHQHDPKGPTCHGVNPRPFPDAPAATFDAGTGTEDCLFLQVFKPVGDVSGLPVLLHIHGGGYQGGTTTLII